MSPFPETIIYRHRRENLKKCSLRGLEQRPDLQFYTYPKQMLPPHTNYLVLDIDAPPLSKQDQDAPLLFIDGTWKLASVMLKQVEKSFPQLIRRSLPRHFRTAYPRRQEDLEHPEWGLATVEALYITHHLLRKETHGLLDNYHWKEEFLEKNREFL